MKQYMRQILVFVLAFAMLANSLLFTFSVNAADREKWETSSFWGLLSFETEKDGDNLTTEWDLLKGGFKLRFESENNTKEDYDQAVANMQDNYGITSINSAGTIIIKVPFTKFISNEKGTNIPKDHFIGFDNSYGSPLIEDARNPQFSGSIRILQDCVRMDLTHISETSSGRLGDFYYELDVFVLARYSILDAGIVLAERISQGKLFDASKNRKASGLADFTVKNKDDRIVIVYDPPSIDNYTSSLWSKYPLYILVVCEPLDLEYQSKINNYINYSDSRVGSIAMNYGYQNGEGEQVIADNIQIVNEAEKSIYNPITGDTTTYGDWTYDYSNRSYNVTTTTGDTMTVTYGDEYVTITEGDTVYNINYITYVVPEPSEPDTSEPDTSEPDGNGGNNGNGNGNNNNDNDDGSGLFDILGELLGSIIKAISDLFTPVIEALVNAIVSIIGTVLEGLGAFVDMLLRFFLEIPKMFAGFTEFLTAVFPFMPQEFVTLIIFGLMLVIISAVVKRIIG